MNIRNIFVLALFALLVMGIVFVAAADSRAPAAKADASADVFKVQPMAGGCSSVCSWCLPLGHGGACRTNGACC